MTELRRVLGVRGAAIVGLGAMLGTGVFAAWTPAVDLAGSALLIALAGAAVVAALNAVSTGSLARSLPQSGGAYAYGRAYLHRSAGVVAGYAFVVGKAASAGAAALTIGAYTWPGYERLIGLVAVALALGLDLRGIVKSVRVTAVLVAIVLMVLGILAVVVVGTSADLRIVGGGVGAPASSVSVLAAAGILFVAFAGYARITVLGEEVRDPVRTIPRAMVMSFAVVIVVYAVLAFAVLLAVNAGVTLSDAPLESMAKALDSPALVTAVRIGAVIAAGGALLSLIAGIGRTLFAMGRGGDAPRALSVVGERSRVPSRAAITAAVLTAMVVVVGGIAFALALSAASILTYYAIAHLAVLARVRTGDARRWLGLTSGLGLIGCGALVAGLVVTALA